MKLLLMYICHRKIIETTRHSPVKTRLIIGSMLVLVCNPFLKASMCSRNHLTWTAAISDTSSSSGPQQLDEEAQSEKFILRLRLLLFMIYSDGGGDISRREGAEEGR